LSQVVTWATDRLAKHQSPAAMAHPNTLRDPDGDAVDVRFISFSCCVTWRYGTSRAVGLDNAHHRPDVGRAMLVTVAKQ